MAKIKIKQTKVSHSPEIIEASKRSIILILEQWQNDQTKKDKIVSLCNTAVKWNQSGQGVKTQIHRIEMAIKSLNNIIRYSPDPILEGKIKEFETQLKELRK